MYYEGQDQTIVEPWGNAQSGKDKVFAAVFPHSDDFSLFPGGLIIKLLSEGQTGYFIRTSNDEHDSPLSPGATMHKLEGEMDDLQRYLGITKRFDFNYKNHYMDHTQITEIRHRLISLFRFLKVDTVITFDPVGHYEENPDHYITALAVEQACWMSSCPKDLPELSDMGIPPYAVTARYYVARGPQLCNRLIDISSVLTQKIEAICCNVSPISGMHKAYNEAGHDDCPTLFDFAMKRFGYERPELAGLRHYEKYHYIGK